MQQTKIITLCLLLICSLVGSAHSGGIDFDLNEPPPEEYLQAEEETDTPEEEIKIQPLSCPAPPKRGAALGGGNKKFQQERLEAASLKDRFARFMQTSSQLPATNKELPDYCDYEKFKAEQSEFVSKQDKKSKDPSEQMFRRSLYLKRCLDVFRSRVEYRLGRKTYLEGVTPLADMSSNEVSQLFMSAPPMEFLKQGAHSEWGTDEQQYKREVREQRLALKENDHELPSQSSADDSDEAELAHMKRKLVSGDSFAKDSMLIMDSKSVKTMIATMLSKSGLGLDQDKKLEDEEYKLAVREELIGAELEHKSEACANFDDEGQVIPPYPSERWPLSDKRPAGRATGTLPDEHVNATYKAPALQEWKRQYLDWSHHKCFHKVYQQFPNCGCCYVVAAVNLAEFVSCTEQENSIVLRKFSEMHVLNCALKYHAYNMGCSGGSVLETLRFIGQAGAYTRKAWRERVGESARKKEYTDLRDVNCPMSRDLPWEEWGRDKVLLNPVMVHPNEWLEALEDGPLVATVQMPRDGLVTYSGGVHDGRTCERSGIWHVMVLVGYGLDEHGIAYWRFRNSFGPQWGDQGHFNLAMTVAAECFAGGVRVYREPVEL